jgi:hypothetical protein
MNAREPIHIDPLLAEVFELLHRMTVCQEDTPATQYAGEALRKLQQYEERQRAGMKREN